MQQTANPALHSRSPVLALIAATAGLMWSLFGVYQFTNQTFSDRDGLVAGGMTLAQAQLYDSLPIWIDIVFAVGTIGGSIGCLLLMIAHRAALPVLTLSFVAYVALFTGDIIYGVFAAFGPPQVVVMTLVVTISAGLVWLARSMASRAGLT